MLNRNEIGEICSGRRRFLAGIAAAAFSRLAVPGVGNFLSGIAQVVQGDSIPLAEDVIEPLLPGFKMVFITRSMPDAAHGVPRRSESRCSNLVFFQLLHPVLDDSKRI
jgi:hypothetical protein